MYSAGTLRTLNCNHDIDKYFEGKFILDDYCSNCTEEILDVKEHNQAQDVE